MQIQNVKLDQLTSIRGLAAWWVVVFHSQALLDISLPTNVLKVISHGYLAVDLFFILSGFVIYLNYHAKAASAFPRSAVAFYTNRLARIYPVHLLMLCGYLLLAVAFLYFSRRGETPDSFSAKSFIESVFLIHAWFGAGMSWNVPSWSVSAEWFVYLMFPVIALILQRYLKEVFSHIALSAILLFLIYYVYSAMDVASLGDDVPAMALVRVTLEFLMGTIVGSLYVHHYAWTEKNKYWILLGFLTIIFVYFVSEINDYALIPAAFFLLIAFMSVEDAFLRKTLSNKVLVYLGEISYSTYMLHYLVYDLLKAGWVTDSGKVNQFYLALSFLVVLVGSMLIHHIVEKPSQSYLRKKLVGM